MSSLRKVVRGAILGGWALLVLSSSVAAQSTPGPVLPGGPSSHGRSEQGALSWGQEQESIPQQGPAMQRTPLRWLPVRPAGKSTPVKPVFNVAESETSEPEASELMPSEPMQSEAMEFEAMESTETESQAIRPNVSESGPGGSQGAPLLDAMETVPGGPDFRPLPMEGEYPREYGEYQGEYYEPGTYGMCEEGCAAACPTHGYGRCDCSCGPHCGWGGWGRRPGWENRTLALFAGVHGFKGPADQGMNGNFGFHEGINWGGPLGGPWGLGCQLGFQAAHSNFSGDPVGRNDRDQIFFTGGLFRRAVCGGLQLGAAFDLLHDSYHGTADLKQIRTEAAWVFSGCREIGFWGAFGVGDDAFAVDFDSELFDSQQGRILPIGPTDTFSLFYRRHFSGGGQGRIWTGLSGDGDALLGADCTVPLGTSWALENSFTYLLPEEGRGEGGQEQETWCVSIQLVWYPGREARCVLSNPFHPLFSVADNGQFLLDER